MKLIFLCAIIAVFSRPAYAVDDETFQKCVSIKDLTLAIATQADKGVTRQDLKSRISATAGHQLVDFVYDFRGAKSNQEIAANQMETCLRMSAGKQKKR